MGMIYLILLFFSNFDQNIRVFLKNAKEVKIKSEDKIVYKKKTLVPPVEVKILKNKLIIKDGCGFEENSGAIAYFKTKENFPFQFEDKSYRGDLILILEKGKILVINKIYMEDYLLGVVPAEMGPKIYPSLEALKAQAVVARSYGYYKMKKPESKFYDLCATPACQVYNGFNWESELSTRAVLETKDLVLKDKEGNIQETFYMATCGGHTAYGKDIFPLGEHSKYFPSKPCFELPKFEIKGKKSDLNKEGSALYLLWNGDLFYGANKFFGIKKDGDLCRGILNFLKERGESCNNLFELPIFKDYYIPYLRGEKEANLLWSIFYKLLFTKKELSSVSGIFSYLDGNKVYLLERENPYCLLKETPLFTSRKQDTLSIENMTLYPGDKIELILFGDNILSLEKQEPLINEFADGRAERAKWLYFISKEELSKRFNLGIIKEIEVLKKSKEGRVLSLKIRGSEGEIVLDRLNVRFKLNLPEVLFEILKVPEGYYFYGSGWGHGVGLCQEGAFGMGAYGLDFKEILNYYYPSFILDKI